MKNSNLRIIEQLINIIMLKVKRIPMPLVFSRYASQEFTASAHQVTSAYKRCNASLMQMPIVPARRALIPNEVDTSMLQRCCYCKQTSQDMQSPGATSSSSSSVPPPPTPPRLPDREQVEKYFFRTIAFVWDVSQFVYLWLLQKFHVHVAQHPTVRQYWQTFLDKLEKSRRD